MNVKLPLDGIKVLDLSFWNFCPAAAAILGDWGADVIHVEPLEGDPTRGVLLAMTTSAGITLKSPINYSFELDNRNKRGLAVDLKKEAGRKIIYKLVDTADVFVTSVRHDALKKLEMDYETISRINPRIIFAHGSGYGEEGPETERGGFDYGAFWARSGLMASHGEPDQPPPFSRPAIGDQTCGQVLAGGIALALLGRERLGIGQQVSLSLLGTGIWMGSLQLQAVLSGAADIPRLSRKRVNNPLYNSYQAGDGKWFVLISLASDWDWTSICKIIGRPELEHDARFNSHEKRMEHCIELIALLDTVFAARPRDEWAGDFDKYNVFWSPTQSYADVQHDPMVLANEYITEVDHPTRGKAKLVMSPIRLSETPPRVKSIAPECGQHNEEILRELGYTWEDITTLKDGKVIL